MNEITNYGALCYELCDTPFLPDFLILDLRNTFHMISIYPDFQAQVIDYKYKTALKHIF